MSKGPQTLRVMTVDIGFMGPLLQPFCWEQAFSNAIYFNTSQVYLSLGLNFVRCELSNHRYLKLTKSNIVHYG